MRRRRETVPRPRHHRHRHRREGADRRLRRLRLGRGGRRQGRDEGDGDLARRPALRPAGRAARVLRQPAPALHRLEGPQRRAARGGGQRRGLSISEYGIDRGRDGRGAHVHDRGGAVRVARLPVHPARAARERRASSRRRGEASCPTLVEESDLRGDLHAHTTWSADGKARWRRWRSPRRRAATRTSRSPTTRTTCATGGSRRRREEIAALNERLKPFRLLHGVEVNIRANGTLDVPDETLAGLDWVVASIHAAFASARRPSACSRRWRTRTSTASAT